MPTRFADAFTEQQARERKQASSGRDCRRDGPIRTRSPKAAAGSREAQVGGVYVPDQLDTHAAIAYILNQEPGKMRTKDVKVGAGQRGGALRGAGRLLAALRAAAVQLACIRAVFLQHRAHDMCYMVLQLRRRRRAWLLLLRAGMSCHVHCVHLCCQRVVRAALMPRLPLQDAIEVKRGERSSEQAQLQALIEEGSGAGGVSPYDRPDVPPGVKVNAQPDQPLIRASPMLHTQQCRNRCRLQCIQ